jgi:hypothetical protein
VKEPSVRLDLGQGDLVYVKRLWSRSGANEEQRDHHEAQHMAAARSSRVFNSFATASAPVAKFSGRLNYRIYEIFTS